MKLPAFQAGDGWGGLAAMLVALPAAIAYGVSIYLPLGSAAAAQGALAGILGAIALGLVAPALGGTPRLITAPSAPAAAVLATFALEFLHASGDLMLAVLLLTLLGLLAGLLQIVFGALRLGQLIVYMPYPVVSGYMTGVGLYIMAAQLPKLLGATSALPWWQLLATPASWQWQALWVGAITGLGMLGATRLTRRIPAAILGLLAGTAGYGVLALADPALLRLEGNPLVIGALGGNAGSVGEAMLTRWQALDHLDLAQLQHLAMPALTLAVLLSIDTLKTCVVLDALTRSRHNSNRELIGQGLGNVVSALVGGVPGSGTMGATLVNLSSGGRTRLSGVLEGVLALLAFVLLGALLSWVPVAALAMLLMVVGARMIDLRSLNYLKQRATLLDFAVIVAVIMTALTSSLIMASGVGIVLAVLLFVREQSHGSIVHRKVDGNQTFSKRVRTHAEMELLSREGRRTVVLELQGSLFFGTSHQLWMALEAELSQRDYVILDMRRVQTIDVTAAHMLDLIEDVLAERHGFLLFSQLPEHLPSGLDMQRYFDQVGLVRPQSAGRVFAELDDALEWVEDQLLAQASVAHGQEHGQESLLQLHEFEIFRQRKPETLDALAQHMSLRSCRAGEKIFSQGERSADLFIIRRGTVRIMLPITDHQSHHLGTFGRGAFFGEIAFLDGQGRSADAVAFTDTELFVLSRQAFEQMAQEHKKLALNLMEGLASVLASRLRYTNAELRVLEA